ncbi:hypothetical protein F0562_000374 [Nyssa sinensis]|uniref:Uncharacterized protein n=1 Tax=Nyssa sinensis TaxID=561372 RepID=A0A5J5C3I9_9ASTE|nr:hypothetical protein F0562_000374 [Nyssa sinensis]
MLSKRGGFPKKESDLVNGRPPFGGIESQSFHRQIRALVQLQPSLPKDTALRGLLHMQGVQALRSANSPFSYIILLNSSFQYKQSSSYNTPPSIEKRGHDDTGYDLLSPYWKLVVYMDPGNPSASSARMLPFYPNQNSSEGKLFSGGFIFSGSVEDDKKQGHRPLNRTQIREMMAIPSFMPSSLDTSGTTSLREIIRPREMKGNVLGSSKKGGLGPWSQ